MVKTGAEQSFKERAMSVFKDKFPNIKLFFFHRLLKSNKGEYFERPIFPGYVFLQIEELSTEFLMMLKRITDFYRILGNNENPTKIMGNAFVPPKVNLDKFIKANKVVKMTGVVIDFSSIPVA